MVQFWCSDGYDDEKDKEYFIKVESVSINISDRVDGGYVERVTFVYI